MAGCVPLAPIPGRGDGGGALCGAGVGETADGAATPGIGGREAGPPIGGLPAVAAIGLTGGMSGGVGRRSGTLDGGVGVACRDGLVAGRGGSCGAAEGIVGELPEPVPGHPPDDDRDIPVGCGGTGAAGAKAPALP